MEYWRKRRRKEARMTVRLLKICLYAVTIVTIVAGLIGLAAVVGNAVGGGAAMTTLPLRIDPAPSTDVQGVSGAAVGTLSLDRGTLNVRSGGPVYAALQCFDILLACGLWIGVFLMFLRLIEQIGSGQPFNDVAVRRLRSVGWMLIALNLWYWLREIALPPVLLSQLQATAGEFRILPMISESVDGLRSARVDGQFGFGLLVGGALALLLAEAFRLGTAIREDNESIL
jgi:hypothetical protein